MNTQKTPSLKSFNRKDYHEIKPLLPYLGVIVLTVLLLFVLVLPKIRQTLSARENNNKQAQRVRELSQKLADIEGLSEAELAETSALLLEALPENNDFYRLLSMVKGSFSQNGVQLEYFDLSPGELGSGSGSLSVKIAFSSSFENFKKLLSALEKSLPLVEVSSVKFKTFILSSETSQVDGEMAIISYYQPLPKSLGKVGQPLTKVSGTEQKIVEELKGYRRYVSFGTTSSEPVLVGKEYPFPF